MAELKNNNSGSSGLTPPKQSRSTLMRAADYNDEVNSLQYDDDKQEDRSASEDKLDDKENKSDSENFLFR